MTSPSSHWPAAVAAVSGSVMVGVMPLCARWLYADGLSAPSMLFWRYVLALVALAVAGRIIRIGWRQAWQGLWRIILLGGTLGAAQTLCFWESLKYLDTSIAVLLFYAYPVVTLALDRLFFNLPIRPFAVLCIAIILGGVGLITLPDFTGGTIDPRGLLWAVPSPLVYACYLAINARLLRRYQPVIGAFGLFFGMAVTFGLTAAFAGLDVPQDPSGWLLLLFIAVGPGAMTMTLFSYSVPRLGASSFAILANTELVTVVMIGVMVMGEVMSAARAVGGALIVAGILAHALGRKAPYPGPLPANGESELTPDVAVRSLSPSTGRGTG